MAQQVFGDRYEIHSRLGRGGMASVYRAMDTRLMREVALKVVQMSHGSIDSDYYFHREARSIAALRHYNIVQVYDYSGPKESPVYLVMELIDGSTLDDVIDDRGALPESVTISLAKALASALEHAHDRGVIHRDIKPGNVMIERSGRALLTDFGIAKSYRDSADLGVTHSGKETALVGTPAFMAPEQINEKDVGPAADIFSLGSLIYCMLAGASPFAGGDDVVEVFRRIIDVDFQPLETRRPDASPPIIDFVHDCLQLDARRRPTATDAKYACDEILRALNVDSPERCVVELLDLDRTAITDRSGPLRDAAEKAIELSGTATRPEGPFAYTVSDAQPAADEVELVDVHEEPQTRSLYPHTVRTPAPQGTAEPTPVAEPTPTPGVADIVVSGESTIQESPALEPTAIGQAPRRGEETTVHDGRRPSENTTLSIASAPPSVAEVRDRVLAAIRRAPPAVTAAAIIVALGALIAVLVAATGGSETPVVSRVEPLSVPAAETHRNADDPTTAGPVAAPPAQPSAVAASAEARPSKPASASPPPAAPLPATGVATPLEPRAEKSAHRDTHRSGTAKPAARTRRTRSKTSASARSPAIVELKVIPWGTVLVDGKEKGNAPLLRTVSLSPGRHTITVRHPGLGESRQVVTVRAGDRKTIKFDLNKRR